jgi:hypothetical protein
MAKILYSDSPGGNRRPIPVRYSVDSFMLDCGLVVGPFLVPLRVHALNAVIAVE